jgi:hypothetical protein
VRDVETYDRGRPYLITLNKLSNPHAKATVAHDKIVDRKHSSLIEYYKLLGQLKSADVGGFVPIGCTPYKIAAR